MKISALVLASAVTAFYSSSTDAFFVPIKLLQAPSRPATTRNPSRDTVLWSTNNTDGEPNGATLSTISSTTIEDGESSTEPPKRLEQELKRRIADKNFNEDESSQNYDNNGEATTTTTSTMDQSMQRLLKTRAYPIFLAEKAAEILEGLIPTGKSDDTVARSPKSGKKERIVILGTGWGAAALLKGIDMDLYEVTVVSPRNYFVFTPMLAGASVGTVEYRSITEPIRDINRQANYLEGTAMSVDPKAKTIAAESVICEGNSCNIEEFVVPYDKLIVTVGAQTNTFGIPGVKEHCNFLKQVEDARRIRTAMVNCFERANLPGLTDDERINNLTFAVIGAGPTGIEFAAELRDFVEEDGPKYYPNLLKFVRIKVIEASSTILAPFDQSLQEEAINQMNRQVQIQDPAVQDLLPKPFQLVELLLDSSVKEVTESQISLNDGTVLDYGLAVWAAGNGPLPLTMDVIDKLGESQSQHQNIARGRIATDAWLRVDGGEGSIMAFGDCSYISEGPDGALPATAQVAAQQGEFLASLFNKEFHFSKTSKEGGSSLLPPVAPDDMKRSFSDNIASVATGSEEYAKPFQFLNLGILAYTGGDSALAQVSLAPNTKPVKGTGKVGNALWKSVYLSKQVSARNRLLVLNDWFKKQLFGRDITRL